MFSMQSKRFALEARCDIAKRRYSVRRHLRNLQTLSEATQLLPQALKDQHPHIPWRQISGFRNILVHNYLGNIDPLTVASVVKQQLQPLQLCIEDMLKSKGDEYVP